LSDIYGRVRLYTIGFAVFTSASALLTATWSTGTAGALEIFGFRLIQGLGAASLFANSAAILTDVFPAHRRGFTLGGGNHVALVVGSAVGLVLGGVLAVVDWRIVFAVSIPFGVAGTLWASACRRRRVPVLDSDLILSATPLSALGLQRYWRR
jgi:MFS family permease